MLKVMLVDDEPFIIQGLKMLIDWEEEGYEIAATAADGKEALAYLEANKVDLVIADIKMPEMSGLELLQQIRERKCSDAFFVILSGFADFSYAQEAIRNQCTEYILKPVEKNDLLKILRNVSQMKDARNLRAKEDRKKEKAYLDRYLIAMLLGKYDKADLSYIKSTMHFSEGIRYLEFIPEVIQDAEELTEDEKRAVQKKIFDACVSFLKEYADHCIMNASGSAEVYDVGLIYCDDMAKEETLQETDFFQKLLHAVQGVTETPIYLIAGKKVADISDAAKSYGSACILRSCRGFQKEKEIYLYEEEMQVAGTGVYLCKDSIDELVNAIEENDHAKIIQCVGRFYDEMQNTRISDKTMHLNINYLLFYLVHLAASQDNEVNQEEILRLISENTIEKGFIRGSKAHFSKFACEYGDYLMQLRKNISGGILGEIEREIQQHYSENLTLKYLSEKYYINTAYLGKIFRKKYGVSFKEYLNKYRIRQAALMLRRTDEKVYYIAEHVGYHDIDYFVNRFIGELGCTPVKYRKQICK